MITDVNINCYGSYAVPTIEVDQKCQIIQTELHDELFDVVLSDPDAIDERAQKH